MIVLDHAFNDQVSVIEMLENSLFVLIQSVAFLQILSVFYSQPRWDPVIKSLKASSRTV